VGDATLVHVHGKSKVLNILQVISMQCEQGKY